MNNRETRISGETYFFRDHGQFDLLRARLLPELIEHRRTSHTLRIWSAGCSSGEEAYSLAMLIDMLLPERDQWDIVIIGSDIDSAALTKAKRARYGQWSFRMAPSTLQQRYFRREAGEWILDENIRHMVAFRSLDLIGDPFPTEETRDMDLILCRNVFIYMEPAKVPGVVDKLIATLNVGGYLMTAHAELIGLNVSHMQSRLFAESIVYQRLAPKTVDDIPPSPRILRPPAAVRRLPTPAEPEPNLDALLAEARRLADRGEYERAESICHRLLSADPLALAPHFLMAQLAQLNGNFENAEALLKKTLYLDPACVAATLELAALYERRENLARAQTLRRAALDTVRALPADATIEPYEITASELVQWLMQ